MPDNFLRGGVLMLAACVMFSLSDTTAKYVTEGVPAVELATIRYAVFVAMASVPLLRHPRRSVRSRRPGLQILRGIGVVGSAVAFILSLGALPIAEATAINFITPLMITVLAIPILGETVRLQGWVAVVVGFLGMLVVVRPGVGGLHPAALYVVLSSLCWCMAMLVTRRLVNVDRSSVTLLWTACTGFVLLLCAVPFFLAPLSLRQAGLCLLVGVVASTGQWLAVLAYRHARATVLAPLTYSQLIWSSVLGYLVFGNIPDRWMLIGAVIIAASGIYVVHLERVRVAALRTGAS
jgi:drug/metabolite transporter (DMT)-like permease